MTYIIFDPNEKLAALEVSGQIPSKDDFICAFGKVLMITSVVWRPTLEYMKPWIDNDFAYGKIDAFIWAEEL